LLVNSIVIPSFESVIRMRTEVLAAVLLLLLSAVVGLSRAAPQPQAESETESPIADSKDDKDDSQAYNYNWEVNDPESKNYYGQEQSADETGRVEGKYYVWLADGRLMTVSYYVDGDSGFVPKITFSDPGFTPPADAPARPT
jgi:hypothetical protein